MPFCKIYLSELTQQQKQQFENELFKKLTDINKKASDSNGSLKFYLRDNIAEEILKNNVDDELLRYRILSFLKNVSARINSPEENFDLNLKEDINLLFNDVGNPFIYLSDSESKDIPSVVDKIINDLFYSEDDLREEKIVEDTAKKEDSFYINLKYQDNFLTLFVVFDYINEVKKYLESNHPELAKDEELFKEIVNFLVHSSLFKMQTSHFANSLEFLFPRMFKNKISFKDIIKIKNNVLKKDIKKHFREIIVGIIYENKDYKIDKEYLKYIESFLQYLDEMNDSTNIDAKVIFSNYFGDYVLENLNIKRLLKEYKKLSQKINEYPDDVYFSDLFSYFKALKNRNDIIKEYDENEESVLEENEGLEEDERISDMETKEVFEKIKEDPYIKAILSGFYDFKSANILTKNFTFPKKSINDLKSSVYHISKMYNIKTFREYLELKNKVIFSNDFEELLDTYNIKDESLATKLFNYLLVEKKYYYGIVLNDEGKGNFYNLMRDNIPSGLDSIFRKYLSHKSLKNKSFFKDTLSDSFTNVDSDDEKQRRISELKKMDEYLQIASVFYTSSAKSYFSHSSVVNNAFYEYYSSNKYVLGVPIYIPKFLYEKLEEISKRFKVNTFNYKEQLLNLGTEKIEEFERRDHFVYLYKGSDVLEFLYFIAEKAFEGNVYDAFSKLILPVFVGQQKIKDESVFNSFTIEKEYIESHPEFKRDLLLILDLWLKSLTAKYSIETFSESLDLYVRHLANDEINFQKNKTPENTSPYNPEGINKHLEIYDAIREAIGDDKKDNEKKIEKIYLSILTLLSEKGLSWMFNKDLLLEYLSKYQLSNEQLDILVRNLYDKFNSWIGKESAFKSEITNNKEVRTYLKEYMTNYFRNLNLLSIKNKDGSVDRNFRKIARAMFGDFVFFEHPGFVFVSGRNKKQFVENNIFVLHHASILKYYFSDNTPMSDFLTDIFGNAYVPIGMTRKEYFNKVMDIFFMEDYERFGKSVMLRYGPPSPYSPNAEDINKRIKNIGKTLSENITENDFKEFLKNVFDKLTINGVSLNNFIEKISKEEKPITKILEERALFLQDIRKNEEVFRKAKDYLIFYYGIKAATTNNIKLKNDYLYNMFLIHFYFNLEESKKDIKKLSRFLKDFLKGYFKTDTLDTNHINVYWELLSLKQDIEKIKEKLKNEYNIDVSELKDFIEYFNSLVTKSVFVDTYLQEIFTHSYSRIYNHGAYKINDFVYNLLKDKLSSSELGFVNMFMSSLFLNDTKFSIVIDKGVLEKDNSEILESYKMSPVERMIYDSVVILNGLYPPIPFADKNTAYLIGLVNQSDGRFVNDPFTYRLNQIISSAISTNADDTTLSQNIIIHSLPFLVHNFIYLVQHISKDGKINIEEIMKIPFIKDFGLTEQQLENIIKNGYTEENIKVVSEKMTDFVNDMIYRIKKGMSRYQMKDFNKTFINFYLNTTAANNFKGINAKIEESFINGAHVNSIINVVALGYAYGIMNRFLMFRNFVNVPADHIKRFPQLSTGVTNEQSKINSIGHVLIGKVMNDPKKEGEFEFIKDKNKEIYNMLKNKKANILDGGSFTVLYKEDLKFISNLYIKFLGISKEFFTYDEFYNYVMEEISKYNFDKKQTDSILRSIRFLTFYSMHVDKASFEHLMRAIYEGNEKVKLNALKNKIVSDNEELNRMILIKHNTHVLIESTKNRNKYDKLFYDKDGNVVDIVFVSSGAKMFNAPLNTAFKTYLRDSYTVASKRNVDISLYKLPIQIPRPLWFYANKMIREGKIDFTKQELHPEKHSIILFKLHITKEVFDKNYKIFSKYLFEKLEKKNKKDKIKESKQFLDLLLLDLRNFAKEKSHIPELQQYVSFIEKSMLYLIGQYEKEGLYITPLGLFYLINHLTQTNDYIYYDEKKEENIRIKTAFRYNLSIDELSQEDIEKIHIIKNTINKQKEEIKEKMIADEESIKDELRKKFISYTEYVLNDSIESVINAIKDGIIKGFTQLFEEVEDLSRYINPVDDFYLDFELNDLVEELGLWSLLPFRSFIYHLFTEGKDMYSTSIKPLTVTPDYHSIVIDEENTNNLKFEKKEQLKFYRIVEEGKYKGEVLPLQIKIGFDKKRHQWLLELLYHLDLENDNLKKFKESYKKYKEGTNNDFGDVLDSLNKVLKDESVLFHIVKDTDGIEYRILDLLKVTLERIPTQNFSMIDVGYVTEFVDTLNKDLVFVPHSMTIKTGQDYDDDKLFTFFYNIKFEKGKLKIKKDIVYYMNRSYHTALKDMDNLLYHLYPVDNEKLDEIMNEYLSEDENLSEALSKMSVFNYYHNVTVSINVRELKESMASFVSSLSATYPILSILNQDDFDTFSKKAYWLSQLISRTVDASNNPKVASATWNSLHALRFVHSLLVLPSPEMAFHVAYNSVMEKKDNNFFNYILYEMKTTKGYIGRLSYQIKFYKYLYDLAKLKYENKSDTEEYKKLYEETKNFLNEHKILILGDFETVYESLKPNRAWFFNVSSSDISTFKANMIKVYNYENADEILDSFVNFFYDVSFVVKGQSKRFMEISKNPLNEKPEIAYLYFNMMFSALTLSKPFKILYNNKKLFENFGAIDFKNMSEEQEPEFDEKIEMASLDKTSYFNFSKIIIPYHATFHEGMFKGYIEGYKGDIGHTQIYERMLSLYQVTNNASIKRIFSQIFDKGKIEEGALAVIKNTFEDPFILSITRQFVHMDSFGISKHIDNAEGLLTLMLDNKNKTAPLRELANALNIENGKNYIKVLENNFNLKDVITFVLLRRLSKNIFSGAKDLVQIITQLQANTFISFIEKEEKLKNDVLNKLTKKIESSTGISKNSKEAIISFLNAISKIVKDTSLSYQKITYLNNEGNYTALVVPYLNKNSSDIMKDIEEIMPALIVAFFELELSDNTSEFKEILSDFFVYREIISFITSSVYNNEIRKNAFNEDATFFFAITGTSSISYSIKSSESYFANLLKKLEDKSVVNNPIFYLQSSDVLINLFEEAWSSKKLSKKSLFGIILKNKEIENYKINNLLEIFKNKKSINLSVKIHKASEINLQNTELLDTFNKIIPTENIQEPNRNIVINLLLNSNDQVNVKESIFAELNEKENTVKIDIKLNKDNFHHTIEGLIKLMFSVNTLYKYVLKSESANYNGRIIRFDGVTKRLEEYFIKEGIPKDDLIKLIEIHNLESENKTLSEKIKNKCKL